MMQRWTENISKAKSFKNSICPRIKTRLDNKTAIPQIGFPGTCNLLPTHSDLVTITSFVIYTCIEL